MVIDAGQDIGQPSSSIGPGASSRSEGAIGLIGTDPWELI